MLHGVLLRYISVLLEKNSVASEEVQRVVKNLMVLFLDGKGRTLHSLTCRALCEQVAKSVRLVMAVLLHLESNLELKIVAKGLIARQNDRLMWLLEAAF